jgi:hypothetical protein
MEKCLHRKYDIMVMNVGVDQGLFILILSCVPVSTEIRRFFAPGYRKCISHTGSSCFSVFSNIKVPYFGVACP